MTEADADSGRLAISVIIPTYNRRAVLARTLPTLFAQAFPPEQYEVLVVVDGSTDGTAEWLGGLQPSHTFRVLEQPNRGPAAARNAGLAVARGRLILFLDDDILCGPTLLREHAAAHVDTESRAVFGPVLVAPESQPSLATDWVIEYSAHWVERFGRKMEPGWPYDAIVDANTSVPRAVLRECGGFDERFGRQRETADLGLRLWAMGVRFRYAPAAVTHQIYVKSSRDLIKRDAVEYGRHSVLLSRKHPDYRPHSALAGRGRGPLWRRLAREAALRLPLPTEWLLAPVVWAAERLRALPRVRRAGVRLLAAQQGIATLRSALREVGSWRAFCAEFGMGLPVLLYHHVGPPRPGTYPELTIPPEQFERQMRWLARRGFVAIRPADWLAWRQGAGRLPKRPVLLTFDDAYADLTEFALPVLERHGFGAAIFAVTGLLGGTNAWDEALGCGTHRLMTAAQVREWAGRGIEFGAHGRTHADLTTLGPGELDTEIGESAKDLARHLGAPPVAFAYPYGSYNGQVQHRVRDHFALAFTCDEGMNDLRSDPHLMRRTMVQPSDFLLDFACRAGLGWSPLERLRSRLRLRTRLLSALRSLGMQPE